jgi:hypothetical protein
MPPMEIEELFQGMELSVGPDQGQVTRWTSWHRWHAYADTVPKAA